MKKFYAYQFKTRIGNLQLSASRKGLYALDWPGKEKSVEETCPKSIDALLKKAGREIQNYLKGRRHNFKNLPIDWSGYRPFQKKVLQILRTLSSGETASYQDLALRAGRPRAARSVGFIMSRNRLPLVIPCHRILPKQGGLGGFSKGVRLKRRLLKLEKAGVDML